MTAPNPTLPIITPHMTLIDLVALARAGMGKEDLRPLIEEVGVEINGTLLQTPDRVLTLQTGDILRFTPEDWFEIEIVDLHMIETERLRLRRLQLEDIELLDVHLPEWDIVRYLSKSLPVAFRSEEVVAREVFRKIIQQREPKDEFLWKISPREQADKIIGVAHLRTDSGAGDQNVWIGREHRAKGLMQEAVEAVNDYAFEKLDLQDIHFKEAFAHAAGAPEIEALRKKFSAADDGSELHTKGAPDKSWGLSKVKWQKLREKAQRPTAPPLK